MPKITAWPRRLKKEITLPRINVPNFSVNPTPGPAFTSSCDSAGYWGSDGTRYNAAGGALVRPDGKTYQRITGGDAVPVNLARGAGG